MPSPFPGMDPYLEGDLWTVVHSQLGTVIAHQLAPLLAPRYVALTQKRFVTDRPDDVVISDEDRYPDVGVVEASQRPLGGLGAGRISAPLEVATVIAESVPHFWVEIRDTQGRKLVTVIEFLSPTNKRGEGRREYLEKRQRILNSTAHLLEIDLLRRGRRVPMRRPLPSAAYFVFLSRAGRRPITEIWPVGLDQPLPTVPVPLLEGDHDVPLDLQQAFTNVYDLGRLDLAVNYTRSPDVPLPAEAAAWAEERLRAAGLRN